MRILGLIELGQAFASVGRMALAEFCRRLPRDKAEELVLAVKNASRLDAPTIKSAQRFLSRVVVNFKDTEEFFHKAGLWRLAKASLPESEAFRIAFSQRIPREIGLLYGSFVEKAQAMDDLTEESLSRLQDNVLLKVRSLAESGGIHQKWLEPELVLHDPQAAESEDAPSEEPP